ncbi:Nucleoside triphosphate pyrophosphohydrolase/pyrophosphatase MazG [Paraliobacillus sp. PM-2]|uniref:nucleoside triphosphate pyrophosphohydrolase n=1 Tax=Paraliobacillus sp. PM-2 TaxID=1462524 RepID=UPI00061B904A|nr:nucleoside triphosphate pyrophosphohydrolase [Paraliobacillus sp. PM-2]CQR47474.1 Nucleoside triphosphate pyrophosphohydrolase/pyrophosphatase MazG [Paraliobacillus sp. PM-2]
MKGNIEIIGLGAGDIEQLSLGVYRKLKNSKQPIYVRTFDHPVIRTLQEEGVSFHSFDDTYEQHDTFEQVYQTIANTLTEKARILGSFIYAVPGHPMLAEKTVQLLIESSEVEVSITGGQSYLDPLFTALQIDPIDGFQFLDATDFSRSQIDYRNHTIFCQVYDSFIASEVKLVLLEDLPPQHPVTVIEAVGSKQEKIQTIELVELDQGVKLSNLTSVYITPAKAEILNHQFFRLRDVIATLRSPSGCPWDNKQTNQSLRNYLIEEAYELIDAINEENDDAIIEELGDVLLQVMLHSQIGEDMGYFTIDDVIESITHKMIRRHPHVFGNVKVAGEADVLQNWQEIKVSEKMESTCTSLLNRVPKSASPLVKAEALQKEAATVGFDWSTPEPIWKKIFEEINECKEAIKKSNNIEIEKEFGDILFAIVNIARYYNVNANLALEQTNQKFIRRFQFIEEKVARNERLIEDYSLEELDKLWNEAKTKNL